MYSRTAVLPKKFLQTPLTYSHGVERQLYVKLYRVFHQNAHNFLVDKKKQNIIYVKSKLGNILNFEADKM